MTVKLKTGKKLKNWNGSDNARMHLFLEYGIDPKKTARPALRTVYLERNPIYKDKMYRKKIILTCPQLTQIDATSVR